MLALYFGIRCLTSILRLSEGFFYDHCMQNILLLRFQSPGPNIKLDENISGLKHADVFLLRYKRKVTSLVALSNVYYLTAIPNSNKQ